MMFHFIVSPDIASLTGLPQSESELLINALLRTGLSMLNHMPSEPEGRTLG